ARPVLYTLSLHDALPISARGGGAMYDMGVYCINAARYCTGMEPVAVQAWDETARRDLFKGVDETMRFRLEFPDDIVADCVTSFRSEEHTSELQSRENLVC